MWVKIDDQFPSHPKVIKAGLEARALFITSLCYSANHLTDGFVTVEVTPLLTAMSQISNGDVAVKKLVEVGLWEVCEGGYMIHDFLVYNPNSDKIRAERTANKIRQAAYRASKLRSNTVSNGVSNGVSNTPPVPVPVPVPNNDLVAAPRNTKKKNPIKEKDTCPQEWMIALYDLTGVNPSTASVGMRKRISEAGKALIESGSKLEDIERFSNWWMSDDWRKKNTPYPTPENVRDNWSKMNGNGAKHANNQRRTEPEYTAEDLAQAERINARRAQKTAGML